MADSFDWKAALAFLGDRLPSLASVDQYAALMHQVDLWHHAALLNRVHLPFFLLEQDF